MYVELLRSTTFLLKLAQTYEKFRAKIDALSKHNPYPFKEWFGPDGRTYIDFIPSEEVDDDVKEFLEDNDFEIVNYLQGLAKDKSGRTYKIGKAFTEIEKRQIKKIQETEQNEITRDRKINEVKNNINVLREVFSQSPHRVGAKNKLQIVISQNPHDVAKMSTDRSWESCMTLGSGAHHDSVFCEVKNGGLVAYLITEGDKNIEKPLARIHIRRFDNGEGVSIALPEDTIYGDENPKFLEEVKKWINEKNANVPGIYSMKGGYYSDTYGQNTVVLPETEEDILNLAKGNFPDKIQTYYQVVDNYADMINEYNEEYNGDIEIRSDVFDTKEEADKYMKSLKTSEVLFENETLLNAELFDLEGLEPEEKKSLSEFCKDRFSYKDKSQNIKPIIIIETITKIIESDRKYSPEFIMKVKDIALDLKNENIINNFFGKFPETLYKDDDVKLSWFMFERMLRSVPPENKKTIEYIINRNAINEFSKIDISKLSDHEDSYMIFKYMNLSKGIELSNNKNLIENYVKIFIDLYNQNKLNKDPIRRMFIATEPMFFNKRLDKDISEEYFRIIYENLWNNTIDIRSSADCLGRNHEYIRKYLPYFYNKAGNIMKVNDKNDIKEYIDYLEIKPEDDRYKHHKNGVELKYYLFVIDSIESEERSNKINLYGH